MDEDDDLAEMGDLNIFLKRVKKNVIPPPPQENNNNDNNMLTDLECSELVLEMEEEEKKNN